jgi:3'(2'), 5'-bisphosphate nucleotidase
VQLTRELETAVRGARAAGAAVSSVAEDLDVAEKTDRSPVTAADRAANAAILHVIRSSFPDDAILSEESKDTTARLSSRRVWIVDPLDGTKEFLARNGEFSIMIGLAVDGDPVVGVVYLPDGDVLYAAATGAGAFVERGGTRQRLVREDRSAGPIRLVGSRSHPDPLLVQMQRTLGITDVEPCGSVGVKCARIAEGRRDLYIHPVSSMKEWDTCAPDVLVRECGGTFTDCHGRPLRYNKPVPVQPDGIMACAAGVLPRVLDQVSAIYGSRNGVGATA